MDSIRIVELQADQREATLPNGLTLTYRPTLVTGPTVREIERLMRKEAYLPFAKMICRIITSWNLTGPIDSIRFDDESGEVIEETHVKSGKPVPLEPEIVQYVNPVVMASIVLELAVDASPNRQTETP